MPAKERYRVVNRSTAFSGPVFDVLTDEVTMPGGRTARRDWMRHPGAVGVVAVNRPDGPDPRVLLVRQYRHPVASALWELPAGLLDVAGEPALETAARELAEEADLRAERWDTLVDLLTTPGCSNEAIRLFLARDLSPVAEAERHVRTHEEADMTTSWVDLDEAVRMVLNGEIQNAACVAGVLAAAQARAGGWSSLRSGDAPWSSRPVR